MLTSILEEGPVIQKICHKKCNRLTMPKEVANSPFPHGTADNIGGQSKGTPGYP